MTLRLADGHAGTEHEGAPDLAGRTPAADPSNATGPARRVVNGAEPGGTSRHRARGTSGRGLTNAGGEDDTHRRRSHRLRQHAIDWPLADAAGTPGHASRSRLPGSRSGRARAPVEAPAGRRRAPHRRTKGLSRSGSLPVVGGGPDGRPAVSGAPGPDRRRPGAGRGSDRHAAPSEPRPAPSGPRVGRPHPPRWLDSSAHAPSRRSLGRRRRPAAADMSLPVCRSGDAKGSTEVRGGHAHEAAGLARRHRGTTPAPPSPIARAPPAARPSTRTRRWRRSRPARRGRTGMTKAAGSTSCVDPAACRTGGRYWVRTSDLFGVNEALSH